MEVATTTEVVYVEEREEIMTINQGGPRGGGGEQGSDVPDSVPTDVPPSPGHGGDLPHPHTATNMEMDESEEGQQGQDQVTQGGQAETCKLM